MLEITPHLAIPDEEIDIQAMRAQGAGGQNVNKVSSAVHLRFDINASSLPQVFKTRLLALRDQRITGDGVVVIKAQQFRSQLKNRDEAQARLADLIRGVMVTPKVRRATRPTTGSQTRRMDSKTLRGRAKSLRNKKVETD